MEFHSQTTVLAAPNGSGKTSILGAIEWALFGELQYQPKENATNDELVNIRHSIATVTLELESDDGVTLIKRTKKAGKRAAEAVVNLPTGEEYVGEAASAAIFRLLGLTFDDFYRAVYLHQESIRGLLTDDPRVRNEALDRLFGVEKLRDMLKALSTSTKPVRDALDKLERSKNLALARLTGAIVEVEQQRERALEEAKKKGLQAGDLSFDSITEIASDVIDDLRTLADAASASIKEQSQPVDLDGIDGFGRRVTQAITLIRQTATNAALASGTTKEIASVDGALISLSNLAELQDNIDKGLKELQDSYGELGTLDAQKSGAQLAVRQLRETQERLGISERIVQATLTYLKASTDETRCPACGQAINRTDVIDRLEAHLSLEILNDMETARKAGEEQRRITSELDGVIAQRDRLRKEQGICIDQTKSARAAARKLLPVVVTDDNLVTALSSRKASLFDQVLNADGERTRRDERVDLIQGKMERLREIGRFLRLDANYREASSRLGTSDEESSVAEQEIESLSSLEEAIKTIAGVVTTEASTRAQDAVTAAQVDIARLYKELCNHPYFDAIQISVESQLVSGIERNSYFIRTQSSSENQQTLASSRLSTAQMNCVALSVYLALTSQLKHNLGFIILDDPSQNLDTEHKYALVNILSRLAPTLQVVVGTQDSELDEMFDRSVTGAFHRRRLIWSGHGATMVAEKE
jgi:recombinational DNA repair ATPase RecF/Sec-independent protein translocase protein TatA